ncbi:MAG: autotransporter-associated beta strand repeat-containing protein [Akkermansiaceae bacterium]|jgi:fibronectin-binding autotransporter adhesin|nr:autotransporter-associated beta strand repeat-containing protein [Akkermansiaceae bacterium]
MKPLGHLLLSSVGFIATGLTIHAQTTLYWDGNDTTADANGGIGTWDAGITSNWDTAATAGASTTWPASSSGDDDAVFGGTAGAVTIAAGGVTANSLTFGTAGYTLSGGNLTLDGIVPSIVNAGAATVNSNLVGTAGLNKIGDGTLTLGGNNSGISGALVLSGATAGNNGGIIANNANAIAGFSSIDIQNGSFLQLQGVTIASTTPITVAGGGGFTAPLGAIRGGSGVNTIESAVTLANGTVRVGNGGTSTTFSGAITATTGSGFGLLIRQAANQGVIISNTGNYWEGTTQLHDGSHYFHAGALPSATNLSNALSASTWFETNGSFTRAVGTGAGQVQFNSTAGRINGFSARGGDLTVNLGGASAGLTWGSGGFTPAILGLAGANATGTLTWQNPINLNGATRTIDVVNGTAAIDAEMTGAISGTGSSVLTKTGSGTLLLSTANSHAGGTVIAGSQSVVNPLRISHANALGTGGLTIGSGGNNDSSRLELTGGITVTNTIATLTSRNNTAPSILNISGDNTLTSNLSSGGGGGLITISSNSGRLTLSGSLGVRNPSFNGSGDILITGNITSPATYRNLTKGGSGTTILAGATNATDGTTTINAGTLQIGNGGANGALGTGAVTNNATLAINRTGTITLSNAISGTGQLTQIGAGTLEITGNSNTYTGGTTLTSGTLLVNNTSGSGLGTGGVTVNGGTLGGTGSFTGAVAVNTTADLSPGASIGTLATGALTLNTGSSFVYELNTTSVVGDLLNVNGNLDLNGTVALDLIDLGTAAALTAGTKFTLISYSGSWTSGDIFNGYADDSIFTFSGNDWLINYDDTPAGAVNGGSFTNAVTLTVVPEPAVPLLSLAALGLFFRRRR